MGRRERGWGAFRGSGGAVAVTDEEACSRAGIWRAGVGGGGKEERVERRGRGAGEKEGCLGLFPPFCRPSPVSPLAERGLGCEEDLPGLALVGRRAEEEG